MGNVYVEKYMCIYSVKWSKKKSLFTVSPTIELQLHTQVFSQMLLTIILFIIVFILTTELINGIYVYLYS